MSYRFEGKTWARWLASFVGFPLAGLAARAVAGPIDDLAAGVMGGLAGGAVLGTIQGLAMRRTGAFRIRWAAATAVGLAAGLGAGAAVVHYGTDAGELVVMGVVSGLAVGLAQALALGGAPGRRVLWALATPVFWGAGWLITSQVIVDADRQHAVFGASGAIVVTALSGLILAVHRGDLEGQPSSSVAGAVRSGRGAGA